MNSSAQLSAAQQLASSGAGTMPTLESSGAADDDEVPELEAVEEDGPVDETGVDAKDIEVVIQQVGCSRAKAVKVLKESGGDLINASVYLLITISYRLLITLSSHGRERVICFHPFCTSTRCCASHSKRSRMGIPVIFMFCARATVLAIV